ncbi:MAG: hypothetical protein QXJ20_03130 [Candidatus Aenigmatarchaeota archaeon]
MVFEEYVSKLKALVPPSINFPDEYFSFAINEARREISLFVDPIIQFVEKDLTTNVQEYNFFDLTQIPEAQFSKLFDVRGIWDQIQYPLVQIHKEQIPLRNFYGYPAFYYFHYPIIGFYPAPSAPFKVLFKISLLPLDLTQGQEELKALTPYTDIIAILGASILARMVGNQALADYYYQIYQLKRQQVVTRLR